MDSLKKRHILSLCSLLISGLLAPIRPSTGADLHAAASAGVGVGYDSNPLLTAGQQQGGGFTNLDLSATADLTFNRRFGLFANLSGEDRTHEQSLSDADYHWVDLRAGMDLVPYRGEDSHLVISMGTSYGIRRQTFTDRATGEVFLFIQDPSVSPVLTRAIPDRLDNDLSGLFLDFHLKMSQNLTFRLDTSRQEADYLNDFEDVSGLDSLDYSQWSIRPGLTLRLNDLVALDFSVAYFALDYDQRTALDQTGSLAAGNASSYRYTQYRAALRMAPGKRWNARLGVVNLQRVDEYDGYFDFTSRTGFASLEFKPGNRNSLQISATASSLEYDRATVTSTPSGELRSSDLLNFTGRFEHQFREHLSFFVEQGVQTSDNPDPIFAYNRNWTAAGVRIRQ